MGKLQGPDPDGGVVEGGAADRGDSVCSSQDVDSLAALKSVVGPDGFADHDAALNALKSVAG